jgi:hypothetical protein
MTVTYTGHSAPCTGCGKPTTFQDDRTGEHHHVICLGAAPAPAPRQAPPVVRLPAHFERLAAPVRARIFQLAQETGGDVDKIMRKSVPLVMDLFEEVRATGRYPVVHHPPYPDILHKPTQKAPHQVWLARPKWTNPESPRGVVERLDVPGAYLNAFITHLPVQALRHDTSGQFDPRQSGVYRITPPAWEIGDLPNPLGAREEPGPLWVAGPTLRQLQRCHTQYQLCGPVQIHEAWTAPASEDLLRGLRGVLAYLRSIAMIENDTLLSLVIKDMYAKFYGTIGESTHNHRMKRPEWQAIIIAQAHANLWGRAYKARQAGLQLAHVGGTDEIHLVGDWRLLWTEGKELSQMKIKEE